MRARLMCRVGELKGFSAEIEASATIGRAQDNSVVVDSKQVAAHHVEIKWVESAARYVLHDLGSSQGTRLDGIPVRGHRTLGRLHVLSLGELSLVFQDLSRPQEDEQQTLQSGSPPTLETPPPRRTERIMLPSVPAALLGMATPAAAITRYTLEVTIGSEVVRFDLQDGDNRVGRTDADVLIPSREVSRRHANVSLRGGAVFLRDEGSTNGTFLKGMRVSGELPLSAGDQIAFGPHEARLIVTEVAVGEGGS